MLLWLRCLIPQSRTSELVVAIWRSGHFGHLHCAVFSEARVRFPPRTSALVFETATSRNRQERTLSRRFPGIEVPRFALCGLHVRKAQRTRMARDLKQVSAESKRRKKNYVRFNFSQWWTWTRLQPKIAWFWPSPSGELKKREPNFAGFCSATVRADFDADWRI